MRIGTLKLFRVWKKYYVNNELKIGRSPRFASNTRQLALSGFGSGASPPMQLILGTRSQKKAKKPFLDKKIFLSGKKNVINVNIIGKVESH